MKLKNYIYKSVVCLAAMLFAACSDIEENDRLIYVKPVQANRAVLIEDFTGQFCLNCPKASEEIAKLIDQYGEDNIIAVGIHCGNLSTTDYYEGSVFVTGLKTDVGEEYGKYWKVTSQPIGQVNRSGSLSPYLTWGTLVNNELQKLSDISLKVENSYDEATRQLTVNTDMTSIEGNYNGRLQVWLVEDNIVTLQTMPSGKDDFNYVHNHVFRDAVNGTWGEAVSLTEGNTKRITNTYTLPEKWNADNVSVVAFVCGTDYKNVEQVVRIPVKGNK